MTEATKRAEEITKILRACSSAMRLPALLNATLDVDDAVFWHVFAEEWIACDDTWDHQADLLDVLDVRGTGWLTAVSPEDAAWLGSLPNQITIYRGCSLEPVRQAAEGG